MVKLYGFCLSIAYIVRRHHPYMLVGCTGSDHSSILCPGDSGSRSTSGGAGEGPGLFVKCNFSDIGWTCMRKSQWGIRRLYKQTIHIGTCICVAAPSVPVKTCSKAIPIMFNRFSDWFYSTWLINSIFVSMPPLHFLKSQSSKFKTFAHA